MTDSLSLRLKPGAAVLMALALITTTFTGVSFANPANGGSGNHSTGSFTDIGIEYDELEAFVGFNDNGTAFGNMSVTLHVYDGDNFSVTFGPVDLVVEPFTTEITHYADFNLTLFFEGNTTDGPMADNGTWYYVIVNVTDVNNTVVGNAYTSICMDNGSECNTNPPLIIEDLFNSVDIDNSGNLSLTEFLNEFDDDNEMTTMWTNLFNGVDGYGNTLLDIDEFTVLLELLNQCYSVAAGEVFVEDGTFENETDGTEYMTNDTAPSDGTYCPSNDDPQLVMYMVDTGGDNNASLTEFLLFSEEDEELMIPGNVTTFFTNIFNHEDIDGNTLLNLSELDGLFDFFESLFEGGSCFSVMAGDTFARDGTFYGNGVESDFMDGDTAPSDGFFCERLELTSEGLMYMLDINGDGQINLTEILAVYTDNNSTSYEISVIGWIFEDSDNNTDQYLDLDEFDDFNEEMENEEEYEPTDEQELELTMTTIDTDGDGQLSLTEIEAVYTDTNSTSDEIIEIGWIFETSDNNSDQYLDLDEFGDFSAEMESEEDYQPTDEQELKLAMTSIDTDGDGQLSLTEILADFTDNNSTSDEIIEIEWIFETSDNNSDQYLDLDEFSDFNAEMESEEDYQPTDEQELKLAMTSVDTDGDGQLSLTEIEAVYTDINSTSDEIIEIGWIFETSDNNSDQYLDLDEFGDFNAEMESEEDYQPTDIQLLEWIDTDGDGQLSLTEIEAVATDADSTSDEIIEIGWIFETSDNNSDQYLDLDEFGDFKAEMENEEDYQPTDEQELELTMTTIDTDGDGQLSLTEILAAYLTLFTPDEIMEVGWIFEASDNNADQYLNLDEFGAFSAEMESEEEYQPTVAQMLEWIDTDGDGSISITEILAYINTVHIPEGEDILSDVETEYIGVYFMIYDNDGNQLLDVTEFSEFLIKLESMEMEQNNEGQDNGNNETGSQDNQTTSHEDDGITIESNQVDVWFEQWDDQTMELVIVELITVDNADEIARLVMMADAEYGNNDSKLDQAEIDMLMNLYALTLNTDEMANGLTLDGQNGTAVDFWIEVDGLLEGDDVVFLRIGTVIAFPTGVYDDSTSHTFTVTPEMDEREDNSTDAEDCGETSIWIHNSDTWNVKTATGFTFDERNNAWYAVDKDCQNHDVITFELEKAENGALPAAEDEDWTWEDEEMNMFPICDWSYSVTFANGTSLSDQGVDDAPESGDYEIVLDDDAAYEIFLFCWDPEGGKMTVDIGSALGNSTNSSIGVTVGAISFKLPAGTGGNYTFDFAWTDEYHTESGTLTVVATGNGTVDLTEVDVDGEGFLPGFTVGLGVLGMLGAAMFAGRRNEA